MEHPIARYWGDTITIYGDIITVQNIVTLLLFMVTILQLNNYSDALQSSQYTLEVQLTIYTIKV